MDKETKIIVIVIIAIIFFILIVVPVVLVVVGLMLQMSSSSATLPEAQIKSAWRSAEPFAIIDYAQNKDGTLTLLVKNNSYQTMKLNSLTISGEIMVNSSTGEPIVDSFSPGDTTQLTGLIPNACNSQGIFSYPASEIIFNYDLPNINEKTTTGISQLTGFCQ
jgi:archaellum component FlaG (FlaF/FlaG flagellin family)